MRRVADGSETPIFARHKLAHGALLFRLELGIGSGRFCHANGRRPLFRG